MRQPLLYVVILQSLFFASFSIVGGGVAVSFSECFPKIADTAEAAGKTDICDAFMTVDESLGSVLQPGTIDVLHGSSIAKQ